MTRHVHGRPQPLSGEAESFDAWRGLGDDSLTRAFRVDRFPTTFVLSSEGLFQQATVGYTTRLGLLWRLWRAS